MTGNDYLDRIPSNEIEPLRQMAIALNHDPSLDTEDWASELGRYYVINYGRPTQWDSYNKIGASLIFYFGNHGGVQ